MDAEVKIDLPQEQIDPEKRLSPAAYQQLMVNWSEAIEREIEAASQAGQQSDIRAAMQRVPLPFGPDCGGDLPAPIRHQMNQRAQQQGAQLLDLATPAGILGTRAGAASPMREVLEGGERTWERPRRSFTITCGSVLGLLVLAAAVAAALTWWALTG